MLVRINEFTLDGPSWASGWTPNYQNSRREIHIIAVRCGHRYTLVIGYHSFKSLFFWRQSSLS